MRAAKWTAGIVAALVLAAILFVLFGLNLLKGPITRAVSEATGRELVIEGDLEPVWSWVHPRFRAEKVTFANAGWASADYLFRADVVEASVAFLPLLRGRVVVPDAYLGRAELHLEQDAEGRRNWVLDRDAEPREDSRLHVRDLTLDRGLLGYKDAGRRIDLLAELSTADAGVNFEAKGRYSDLPLVASGHGGPVLQLRGGTDEPYPLKAVIRIGQTAALVDGRITALVGLAGIDTAIELSGESMAQLYEVLGVAFPETPPYRTAGRLIRDGTLLRYENFSGKVGKSDLSGTLQVDTGPQRPFMEGALHSKVMDLGDLGILVGTGEPRKGGVLPDSPFDPDRWDSVDADVTLRAGTIKRPEQLPLENLATRVRMRDRVLTLDPLEFGIAGGKLAGSVRLDGTRDAIRAAVDMQVQGLRLARLFPTIEQNKTSVGRVGGLIQLDGRGNSVAGMLGTADGKIGLFMDGGRISRFMMELAALDLWDAAKMKLEGDEPIEIRCAIADFAVKDGVLQTNAVVFDTSVVVVEGGGTVDLKDERMDLKLHPKPKDNSVASLNSPLYMRGTFSDPQITPDMGKMAAKGLGALLLGIVNPVLAVLPLFKEGKGEDSNCGRLIAEAASAKSTQQKAPPGASTGSSKPAK